MPRGHSLSIYARFSGKKRTSLYSSREKGDHYYIQTGQNDLFSHFHPFLGKLKEKFARKARVNTTERVYRIVLMPPRHFIILFKSNKFNIVAVSVKRSIDSHGWWPREYHNSITLVYLVWWDIVTSWVDDFVSPSIVVCYYWSSYYRNSGWISLAEEGLSEADICDDFVRQHVSSWTSVCYTGIIYRFNQGQKRSSCENFRELSFWSNVSELVISWIPLVVSGELKRVTLLSCTLEPAIQLCDYVTLVSGYPILTAINWS